MDVPPSRYRVEEKDGRLIVIDTATGSPATPRVASPSRPGLQPIAPGKGLVDMMADFLVARATRGRDDQGRAVVAWEWKRNGRTQRWDAALDSGQERRLGRTLLSLVAVLPIALACFIAGLPVVAFLLAVPLIVRGAFGLNRLQAETNTSG